MPFILNVDHWRLPEEWQIFSFSNQYCMKSNSKSFQRLLPFLLAVGVTCAQSAPEQLRTDGIYRSEVEINEDGVAYISMLRFAPNGRVFLTHARMPAAQERVWADSSLKCNTCHRVMFADAKHPIQALSTAPA